MRKWIKRPGYLSEKIGSARKNFILHAKLGRTLIFFSPVALILILVVKLYYIMML